MFNLRSLLVSQALIFAALGASAASLYDVENAIQSGAYLKAKALLTDMEKHGFSHDDVADLLYFSELASWESRFRQEADAFDRMPNPRTYALSEQAWRMISQPDAAQLQRAKISQDVSSALINRLAEDRDRYQAMQKAFAGKKDQIDADQRQAQADEEAAIRDEAKRKAAEHDAKIKADAERRHADLVAYESLRKFCGGEPGQPRIGMPESKLSRCVPGLHLSQQVNRADGVLSILLGPAYRVDTIGGYVVAWKSLW